MLRYIQQSFHKVLRSNHARAPVQKGTQESEDFELFKASKNYQQKDRNVISRIPLSEPINVRNYVEDRTLSSTRECRRQGDSNRWRLHPDILKGIVLGTSFALLNSLHGYCSGRKETSNRSKFCPVTFYKQYGKSSILLKSIGSLLPASHTNSLGFYVLPNANTNKYLLENTVLPENSEGKQAVTFKSAEYEHAKAKVQMLSDRLCNADADYLAADHMRALQAWQEDEFETAVSLWQHTVHKFATPIAANKLGMCYEHGTGVERDYKQAQHYYKLASSHGCALAMYNWAMLQLRGLVEETTNSQELIKKSAELNCSKAQTYLGTVYFNNGSKEQAVKYFKQAATNNDMEACYYLAICYETGSGLNEQDDIKALEYYTKAAKAGHADAQYNLAVFYEEGYGGIDTDQAQAVYWYKLSASNGNKLAKVRLESLGHYSLKPSLSLPALGKHLTETLCDLADSDLTKTQSESQLSRHISLKEYTVINTPHSSLSSLNSDGPKFFIPSNDEDYEDVTFSNWSDTSESSFTSDMSSEKFVCDPAYSFNKYSLKSWSHDSLCRPDAQEPQIVFA